MWKKLLNIYTYIELLTSVYYTRVDFTVSIDVSPPGFFLKSFFEFISLQIFLKKIFHASWNVFETNFFLSKKYSKQQFDLRKYLIKNNFYKSWGRLGIFLLLFFFATVPADFYAVIYLCWDCDICVSFTVLLNCWFTMFADLKIP